MTNRRQLSKREDVLFRAGNIKIRKLAKRSDYTKALWRKKNGCHAGRIYRISRRVKDGIYMIWNAYGYDFKERLSLKITVMDLVKKYELVEQDK